MQRSTAPVAAEPSRAAPMSPSTAPAEAERAAGLNVRRMSAREAFLLRADGTENSTGLRAEEHQHSGTHVTEHSTGGGGTRGWVLQNVRRRSSEKPYLLRADGTEISTGGGTEPSTGGTGTARSTAPAPAERRLSTGTSGG